MVGIPHIHRLVGVDFCHFSEIQVDQEDVWGWKDVDSEWHGKRATFGKPNSMAMIGESCNFV